MDGKEGDFASGTTYDPKSDSNGVPLYDAAPRDGVRDDRRLDLCHGGAPMTGGSVQWAVNKAFTLGRLPRFVRSPRIVVQPRRSGTAAVRSLNAF
jgi:hypothetical protein